MKRSSKQKRKTGRKRVSASRLPKVKSKVQPTEQGKPFLIAVIAIAAVIVLSLLLLFSRQLVGKAIAVNAAGAELVSPAYTSQPFSLKIIANTEAETTSVKFTLILPKEMDCSYVAAAPVKNLIEGWEEYTNECDDINKKITFYSQKKFSMAAGKKGLFEVGQIEFSTKGLSAKTYAFTFGSFLALGNNINNIKTLPGSIDVTVQEQPKVAVCGNGAKEDPEQCDDNNKVTEACDKYGQSCAVCDVSCQLVSVKGPSCGDGNVNSANGEECDDGNTKSDDGCSSSCKLESNAVCGDNVCNVKFESTSSCAQDCGLICPTNGLLSWWKGENNAQDSYKFGHNAVFTGNAAYTPGIVGQAFKFDGVDDVLDLGSKAGTLLADPTNSSLSVSFWMKTAATKSPQGSMYIIDTGAGTDGRRGLYCNTAQGTLYCAVRQAKTIYKVSASNVIPLNSWKYVTLAFDDNTNELKLYIDGASSKTGTEEQISGDTFASPQSVIGATATNTKSLLFNGSLDEISVWSRALTSAEVKNIYGAGATGMCSIPSFVCGNGILEAGEECDEGDNIDGDGCSSICQKESAICGDSVCEIKFESTVSCPQDCGLVCPTNGLVSWWKGESGEDSFSGHNGILGGDAMAIPGKVDNAFYFDGQGDYLSLGQKPGTIFSDPTGSSLSVSFWMRTNATKGPQGALYILDSGAGTAARRGFYCSTNQGKLDCAIKHANTIYQVSANNAVPLNVWKFVTFTFDTAKEELKLYVDGASVASGTKATLSSASSPVPASVIGATNLQTLSFNGLLDEMVVWNRVLTPLEVRAIFDTDNIGMCAVPEAICGNGFVETGEECDDGNVVSADACNLCKNAICGDGIIRTGVEQCDGNALAGASCQTLGFANGTLSCGASCMFNNTACMAAPSLPPPPPNVTFSINGTKISLGEIAPANNTFSTLLTATESFSQKIMAYTVLYGADGKVLKLEADDLTNGMRVGESIIVTVNHPLAEVKKKSVIVFDVEPNPTVYGKMEKTYS
ncbi:MAG: LamG-like jellyroll fold domain-containing protein [Nanoarchaeota archaeon]|nr:LamG-like jellyroll fold domain-containing protein [Nanoarchaeota archaeon]